MSYFAPGISLVGVFKYKIINKTYVAANPMIKYVIPFILKGSFSLSLTISILDVAKDALLCAVKQI